MFYPIRCNVQNCSALFNVSLQNIDCVNKHCLGSAITRRNRRDVSLCETQRDLIVARCYSELPFCSTALTDFDIEFLSDG